MEKVKISIHRNDPREEFLLDDSKREVINRFFDHDSLFVLSSYTGKIEVYLMVWERKKNGKS